MNQHLQKILDFIQQSEHLSEEEKTALTKSVKSTDSDLSISEFKLDRTEKVKRTTAILLEETIEELEQKRKAVEAQNRELEIETALERVRTVAMSMIKRDDLLNICRIQFEELTQLGFSEIRNAMINIYNDDKESLLNYDYSEGTGKTITHFIYNSHPAIDNLVKNTRGANDAFIEYAYKGKELDEWRAFRKKGGEADDPKLDNSDAVYYYFYSIGSGSIGISTYIPIGEEKLKLLKRFRNVFNLSYQRYTDISKAEAQTREAQINLAVERVRAKALAMFKSEEILEVVFKLKEEVMGLDIPNVLAATIYLEEKNESVRIWDLTSIEFSEGKYHQPMDLIFQLEETDRDFFMRRVWNGKEKYFLVTQDEEDFKRTLQWLRDVGRNNQAIETEDFIKATQLKKLYHPTVQLNNGKMCIDLLEPPEEEIESILTKMGAAFNLAYKRFEDLKNSEAQLKEAKIETALEKVRSRSLAMHKSDELQEVVNNVFERLKELDIDMNVASIFIFIEGSKDWQQWVATSTTNYSTYFHIPYVELQIFRDIEDAKKTGAAFYAVRYSFEQKNEWFNYAFANTEYNRIPQNRKKFILESEFFQVSFALSKNIGIQLAKYSGAAFSEKENEILVRFSKVFQQAYTRFLDLQKAEAQAREATIEMALEKVRSRSMGMQKSEELKEVIQIVYEQFVQLNLNTEHAGFVMDYKLRDDRLIWVASKYGLPSQLTIPYFDSVYYNRFNEAKEKGWDFFATNLDFEEKNNFYRHLFTYIPGLSEEDREFYFNCSGLAISTVLLENIGLYIENFEGIPYSDEDNAILMRFGKVFQQTYTRFLDLQKAEAQAREAKIEAALERVRSRAMAIRKSDELTEVIQIIFQEFNKLGLNTLECSIVTYDSNPRDLIFWSAGVNGYTASNVKLQYMDHPVLIDLFNDLDKGIKYRTGELSGDLKKTWIERVTTETDFKYAASEFIESWKNIPRIYYTQAVMNHGFIEFGGTELLSDDKAEIVKRFTNVVDLTYTRYDDVVKAEAQAREAEIELALERVRARTMAMQYSNDLSETASVLFQQIKDLGFETWSCGFCTWQKDDIVEVWMGAESGGLLQPMMIPYKKEPTHHDIYKASLLGEAVHQKIWEGKALEGHYTFLRNIPSVATAIKQLEDAGLSLPTIQCYNVGFFKQGYLLLITKETSVALYDLTKRFAGVFEQTYTRFLDLQKAEAQAKESQIEVALERVRSRTLAMQKSDELAETAAVLFKQLIHLGIEPNRLYIAIIEDKNGYTEFWITDEDGSKVSSAFHTNLHDNASFNKMFDGWKRERKSLIIDMKGEELQEYFRYLENIHVPFKGGLTQKRRIQHLAYFSKGFIGMASPDDQPEATMLLLERFAAVFNLTFTRFNDLKLAEAHAIQAEEDLIKLQTEKKRAEDALTNLQAAQKQLVQSEKMASLGELTAGIAHEIQNPLNFVNNFSEVSIELIKEMVDEADKGNTAEVKAIVDDIIQNLEKINHHGKRADAIVKGMLQHSQSSTGQKQPTDINTLADEYIRLCYHGLRAKDKSFNATIKTDFDKSIEKINIIPHDIGRVIMNLLTNAFYAVNEKKKACQAELVEVGYEPTVSITTKQINGKLEIIVSDNGNGIPKNIVDKIFQPFFTTKPTGQGTGLGLSLSYDIITKGHGGELKVETKENEETTFIVQLPVS